FFGNARPEIARRATEDNAAQVGELSLQLGIGEARIDLLVELVDDLGRRLCRCAKAEIAARLVARHKFGHGWNVRQRVRARYCAHRQRAQLARPDYSIEAGMVSKPTCTCPARRSISAGPLPRYWI